MITDKKLLDKYNVPVPRYTSYPPANHFDQEINTDKYLSLVDESNGREPSHLAFYIHIPFCKKICHYCGCNSCSLGRGDRVNDYMQALRKEIITVASHIDNGRKVSQVHFGGGTPNAIDLDYLAEIIGIIGSEFDFSGQVEIAVECNPSFFDNKHLDKLLDAGFNRISIGVQDFNRQVLANVNRDPSAMSLEEVLSVLRSGKNDVAVNMDFIYGLPGQDEISFRKTIEKAAELKPDRLVTFSYAHVPWLKKNQAVLEKKGLPSAEEKAAMFNAAYRVLTGSGYMPVGLDHFVLPGDDLYKAMENNMLHRNFQGYCTRKTTGQVYAFGASAISQLDQGYIQNVKSVDEYIMRINTGSLAAEKGLVLTDVERGAREIITSLMCNKYINWQEIAGRIGLTGEGIKELVKINGRELEEFSDDGLIEYSPEHIKVTDKGSMFIRNIAASIDPAYELSANKYSKSV